MTAMTTNSPDVLAPSGRRSVEESEATREGVSLNERARNLYRKGKDKAIEVEDNFENYVGAHPIKSVLVAGGIGLAVGFLLGRRR
jgi:ElaB/YqjD/DUF883 family membrane-anchored ribosome-binding protein